MHPLLLARLVFLLLVANGSPIIATRVLGARLGWPLDHDLRWTDGRPWFGPSKTLRGVATAVGATAIAGALVGPGWETGTVIAAAAMVGDLLSSFVKRRSNRPVHSRATGLDQIPESLLPLLAVSSALSLTAPDVVMGVAVFVVGEVLLSRWLYKEHLRDRPY